MVCRAMSLINTFIQEANNIKGPEVTFVFLRKCQYGENLQEVITVTA